MTFRHVFLCFFFVAYSVYCLAPADGRTERRFWNMAVVAGIGAIAFRPPHKSDE